MCRGKMQQLFVYFNELVCLANVIFRDKAHEAEEISADRTSHERVIGTGMTAGR